MSNDKSLTKSINLKMPLGNTVMVWVSEVLFYATIEWE